MPSFGFLTLDIIILIVIAAILFLFSFSKPKTLAKCLIAVYITVLIFINIPYLEGQGAAIVTGAFAILFAVIFFLIRKSLKLKKLGEGNKFLSAILLTLSSIMILAVLYYKVLPISNLYSINLAIEPLFTGKVPLGLWYLLPIVVIFFVARDGE